MIRQAFKKLVRFKQCPIPNL